MSKDSIIKEFEKYKGQFVITSTWRKNHNKEFFIDILGKYLHKDYKTKVLYRIRGLEIEEWLDRHKEVKDYIILDDDIDFTEYQKKNHLIFGN